ncbi:hypothetical protein DFP73DRAFT_599288 [Morchella snyderi]|nr:hypothetical protein DFP73DRAFT_599288 [Morchella snyderi]
MPISSSPSLSFALRPDRRFPTPELIRASLLSADGSLQQFVSLTRLVISCRIPFNTSIDDSASWKDQSQENDWNAASGKRTEMTAWEYARKEWEYARTAWEYARTAWEYDRMVWEYDRMVWEMTVQRGNMSGWRWENDSMPGKDKLTAAIVFIEDIVLPATASNCVHSQCVVEHGRDEADEFLVDAAFKLRIIDGDDSICLVVTVYHKTRYLGCGKMPFNGLNASVKGPNGRRGEKPGLGDGPGKLTTIINGSDDDTNSDANSEMESDFDADSDDDGAVPNANEN